MQYHLGVRIPQMTGVDTLEQVSGCPGYRKPCASGPTVLLVMPTDFRDNAPGMQL